MKNVVFAWIWIELSSGQYYRAVINFIILVYQRGYSLIKHVQFVGSELFRFHKRPSCYSSNHSKLFNVHFTVFSNESSKLKLGNHPILCNLFPSNPYLKSCPGREL